MNLSFPTLAMTYWALGCAGGNAALPIHSTDKAPSGQESNPNRSGLDDTPNSDTTSALESEDTSATPPTPVAGAFLTSTCAVIDDESDNRSRIASKNKTLIGCRLSEGEGQITDQKVELTSIEVDFSDKGPRMSGKMAAQQDSSWHQIFSIDGPTNRVPLRYLLKGRVNNLPVDFYRSFANPDLAQVDLQPSTCPQVDFKSKVFSSVMDFKSSRALIAPGLPPAELFPGTSFFAKDRLILESVSGRAITRTLEKSILNHDKDDSFHDCPGNWVVTFSDKNQKILGELNLSESRTATVPAGTFKVWLGYRDALAAHYASNEGGSLATPAGNSTSGCHFKFVREPVSCLSK